MAGISEALIPAAQLLPEFPVETVDSITANQIRNGRDFRISPFPGGNRNAPHDT